MAVFHDPQLARIWMLLTEDWPVLCTLTRTVAQRCLGFATESVAADAFHSVLSGFWLRQEAKEQFQTMRASYEAQRIVLAADPDL
jgi:hypothetical protein